MESYSQPIQIRWSDIDANNHLRHSAFYDYGAWLRVMFLTEKGIDMKWMHDNHIGPILFREEAIFKREIRFGDKVTIDVETVKATKDYSRWSLRHTFIKEDGTIAAILNLDGAWLNTSERKIATPSEQLIKVFDSFPKAKDFEWIIKPSK
jgi:acyl-CoA thioester hydrolase